MARDLPTLEIKGRTHDEELLVQFCFDESGDFNPPPADTHGCSIVCGVTFPETSRDACFTAYQKFLQDLPRSEQRGGEPKGCLLSDDSRNRFCDIINAFPSVLVTPVTLDLSWHRREQAGSLAASMKEAVLEKARSCVYQTMRDEMGELARQWGNLSESQCLRLLALGKCFQEAIQHSIIFHSSREFNSCWSKMDFIVDAAQKSPASREAKVFGNMVLMWLAKWSSDDPIVTIDEIHTEDHPFVQGFCVGDGVDLGKMIREHVTFEDSAASCGLQIADICSNIVYDAVHDLDGCRNRLPIFQRLMKNCPYGPDRGGPCLITVTGPVRRDVEKYSRLYREMNLRQRKAEQR